MSPVLPPPTWKVWYLENGLSTNDWTKSTNEFWIQYFGIYWWGIGISLVPPLKIAYISETKKGQTSEFSAQMNALFDFKLPWWGC